MKQNDIIKVSGAINNDHTYTQFDSYYFAKVDYQDGTMEIHRKHGHWWNGHDFSHNFKNNVIVTQLEE